MYNELKVEVRLYGHWDIPLFKGGQVHVDGQVSEHVSVYIHQLASVMFQVLWIQYWVTARSTLSASRMLAGATESVSVVILVYSAHYSSDFYTLKLYNNHTL